MRAELGQSSQTERDSEKSVIRAPILCFARLPISQVERNILSAPLYVCPYLPTCPECSRLTVPLFIEFPLKMRPRISFIGCPKKKFQCPIKKSPKVFFVLVFSIRR